MGSLGDRVFFGDDDRFYGQIIGGCTHRPHRHSQPSLRRLHEGYRILLSPQLQPFVPGIGDSETTDTDLLDTERAIADIRSALDHLDARGGAGTYVAAGLCTGAFNAFRMVEQDERVVGAVMIDGYAYPTRRSRMDQTRTRWLDPHVWFDRLVRRIRKEPTNTAPDDLVVYENVYVSQEEFGERLASVLDRNIPLLLMYTRFGPLDYTYRQQVCDNYPDLRLDERTTIRYYRTADHTFTLEENRAQAVADIVDWIESNYGTRR